MRFLLNNRCNWREDLSHQKYLYLQKIYFKHLLKLKLPSNSVLIKYFASDFFHDSFLDSLEYNLDKKTLIVQIIREEADLEDINDFRKKRGIKPINLSTYRKNPIIYEFKFSNINRIDFKSDFEYLTGFMIMDSEIDSHNKHFKLTISQDTANLLTIYFKNCHFRMVNSEFIKIYTGGIITKLPYCKMCKNRILNRDKIEKDIWQDC